MRTFAVALAAFGILAFSFPGHAEKVEILTFDYPPFMDASDPDGGLMGEIIHAAFAAVAIDSEIVYYPPMRMFTYFMGTEAYLACIGPVSLIDRQPEEKRNQITYVSPFVDIIMVLCYHKPTHGTKPTSYNDLSDLRGYRMGVIRGSNTITLLSEKGIQIIETGVESQIKMLKANRIDYSAIGFLTGSKLIERLFPDNVSDFAFIQKPIMELPSSIYFNKAFPRSDAYAERFDNGLRTLINSGEYMRILEKYYGKGGIPSAYAPIFDAWSVPAAD